MSDDFGAPQDPPQQPRPLPTSLQSGEREIVGANGAEITFSDEFKRYAVHDGVGRLAGWRKDLESARALATTLKSPPPPEGHRNGR